MSAARRPFCPHAGLGAVGMGVLLLVLAACGVGTDGARPFGVPTGSPSAARSASASDAQRIYLVRDTALVPVRRALPDDPAVSVVLTALEQPVTRVERSRGLRSVVGTADPTAPLVTAFGTGVQTVTPAPPGTGPTAQVVATDALRALPLGQQVLALGQVVLSLDRAGFGAVAFVDDQGSPLAVPAPGGRALDRPVTAADYAALRTTPSDR